MYRPATRCHPRRTALPAEALEEAAIVKEPSAEAAQPAAPTRTSRSTAIAWQVLQYSDALDLEFASALAATAEGPVVLWEPDRSFLPVRFGFRERERRQTGSSLRVKRFPVMRGYARPGFSMLSRIGSSLAHRLGRGMRDPARSVLVCTTPFFAPVAERWRGPVVYWLTDLIVNYEGANPAQVRELDERMCRAATLVCPASERLAQYLTKKAGCHPRKIEVLPNAARVSSILREPLIQPAAPPTGTGSWIGPVAGVMGNLADNMDWVFLQEAVERTPWLQWVFVGPYSQPMESLEQQEARDAVIAHPRARFVGKRPHRELVHFARAFTVAVLPYRKREPTYSGSSTRFYEHLAACHPILATPCVAELEGKEPLLKLTPTAGEAVQALEQLRALGFQDGMRVARWEASRANTWVKRAEQMRTALTRRSG